jgi:DNA-binding NtrC family response regulator
MCNILVVENNPHLRLLYLEELQHEGHQVIGVGQGEQALEVLDYMPIELVVLDLSLPEHNGLDYLREMLEAHPKLKVIINTAYPRFKLDFRSWGAERFLIKSSDLSELKNAINEVVAESQSTRTAPARKFKRKSSLQVAAHA